MKIAINGFGRIGRNVLKIAYERSGIDIVAINDVADHKTLAHLLKHDSSYGVYNREVTVNDASIVIDGQEIRFLRESNPANLPWESMEVDVVVESTGVFRCGEALGGGYRDHIKVGAKKVILSAPSEDKIDETIIFGVNDKAIESDAVAYSCSSCTANCLAPLLKIIDESLRIQQGFITVIHSYSNDQSILDSPHPFDLRKSRAAALNIIPAGTAAITDIGILMPALKDKLKGIAMGVPVSAGCAVDLVLKLDENVDGEHLNALVRDASENTLKGIVEYSEAPLVSSDIRGNSHSAIFDSKSTMSAGAGFIKTILWYDSEFGYSSRLVDLARKLV